MRKQNLHINGIKPKIREIKLSVSEIKASMKLGTQKLIIAMILSHMKLGQNSELLHFLSSKDKVLIK